MRVIDTHAHAFELRANLAADRRYTPDHAAPLAAYLAELDRCGITHAVLVQPSFLGTDNSYMLDCLRRYPDRLRGIAVVDRSWDERALSELAEENIVGLRLNVLGKDIGFAALEEWQSLFRRAAKLDWQVEVHLEGGRLPRMLDALEPSGVRIVIDHFGRFDPALGLEDPAAKDLLQRARDLQIWVKLSGPYRCRGNVTEYAREYLAALGPERLLWGSDWPWTQHDEELNYEMTRGWLDDWIGNSEIRAAILDETPSELFGFGA
jgi:predicted TIM-barrel fold metal-dependent hydrolase